MQLSELLEENSAKAISQKTKISEDNIEYLLKNDFSAIKKVKTLGFISILEREYDIDLGKLREDALDYYSQEGEDESVTIGLPIVEEKKGRSKLLWFVVPILLGYVTWFFLTKYDQSQLKNLLPFNEAKTIENIISNEIVPGNEELSIKNVIVAEENETEGSLDGSEINNSVNY